jgi:alpha-beta hydrolase superfamily lysophospholipase
MAQGSSENASSGKPTIVIIPGGACPTPFYTDLVSNLTTHGYETHVHNLRSYTRNPEGAVPGSLADDAAYFHDKIEALADAGKDVVVVAHSYGGLVATDAAHGLSKVERAGSGQLGGVVRIVYLSCIVGPVGSTSSETCANLPKFEFMEAADEVCYSSLSPLPVFSTLSPKTQWP